VLLIEKVIGNVINITLRHWINELADYSEQFSLPILLSDKSVKAILDRKGAPASLAAKQELQGALEIAEKAIAAGTVACFRRKRERSDQ
jgi:hypothetical protein